MHDENPLHPKRGEITFENGEKILIDHRTAVDDVIEREDHQFDSAELARLEASTDYQTGKAHGFQEGALAAGNKVLHILEEHPNAALALDCLRQLFHTEPESGEKVAKRHGITRQGVNKLRQKLAKRLDVPTERQAAKEIYRARAFAVHQRNKPTH